MSDQAANIILTAFASPVVCFAVYVFWKSHHSMKKIMRRNELVEAIKENGEVRRAIIGLVTEKMKDDYLFQQAVVTLVIEQLQKDWKLEKAVISIAKKA
jgi:3-hydroxyacyl-CoA dehydrogenase